MTHQPGEPLYEAIKRGFAAQGVSLVAWARKNETSRPFMMKVCIQGPTTPYGRFILRRLVEDSRCDDVADLVTGGDRAA